MGGVLCIDHGEKRAGLAIADGLRIVQRPLEVCEGSGEELIERLATLLEEHDITTLLVGMPYHLSGDESPRTKAVRAFMARLEKRFPSLEVLAHDERLSTKEAESLMAERGEPVRERRGLRDSYSALVILRDWIAAGEPRESAS